MSTLATRLDEFAGLRSHGRRSVMLRELPLQIAQFFVVTIAQGLQREAQVCVKIDRLGMKFPVEAGLIAEIIRFVHNTPIDQIPAP